MGGTRERRREMRKKGDGRKTGKEKAAPRGGARRHYTRSFPPLATPAQRIADDIADRTQRHERALRRFIGLDTEQRRLHRPRWRAVSEVGWGI